MIHRFLVIIFSWKIKFIKNTNTIFKYQRVLSKKFSDSFMKVYFQQKKNNKLF